MPEFISNARMYSVAPAAETAWQNLLTRIADDAGAQLRYETYAAPQPLEVLWRRPDIGCVQMCGYPIALNVADVVPIAAPVPAADWTNGEAVYRSDLIVKADAPYEKLEDTFAGIVGWTVDHSHSGFNALRHHLLKYRRPGEAAVYANSVGNLITARGILDKVLDGTIDIGPLDAYWHMLLRKYAPDLTAGVRVLDVTETAPMPAFVASPSMPTGDVERLRDAFVKAHERPWFEEFQDRLLIEKFSAVTAETFQPTMEWDQAAKAVDYPIPA